MIGTNSKKGVFTKKPWATDDLLTLEWVNQVVWRILGNISSSEGISRDLPSKSGLQQNTFKVCSQVLLDNHLHGFAASLYQKELPEIFVPEFEKKIADDQERTERFFQEMKLVLYPQLGNQAVMIEEGMVRRLYDAYTLNSRPTRLVRQLVLWTPTLSFREETIKVLSQVGYEQIKSDEAYHFEKITLGLRHRVLLRSLLWETSKNWTTNLEREMWERLIDGAALDLPRFDPTDTFLLGMRFFAIDSLLGNAAYLLDLVMMLESWKDSIDWLRLKVFKNLFQKPDWFWASMLALEIYEEHTGKKLEMPQWVRDHLADMHDSFWRTFIESRLSWANPDTKMIDYSRALIKLTRG